MKRACPPAALAATALAAALSGPGFAAPRPALAKAAAAVPVWAVDKAASRIGFRGAFGGEAFDGAFRRWDADIAFDPKSLAASRVSVTVDLASAATGDPTRDQALPTEDWFAIRRFPKATFVSRAFRQLGPGRYAMEGDLSIRGVKRPLTLPFSLAIAGKVATMQGAVGVDRTAFGVGQGQFKSGDTVSAQVAVGIKLTARTK